MSPAADPVVLRFRAALDAVLGDRIERVALFGSRARGDRRPGSDDDVAVLLTGQTNFGEDSKALSEIGIELDAGRAIDASPLSEGSHRDRTTLMAELRRDGVDP